MIKPTIGRVVHYRMADWKNIEGRNGIELYSDEPCTAFIAYVWSDTCINLSVLDHAGRTHIRTSVPINVQPVGGAASAYAEWMPYQVGQAAKTEAAEKALSAKAPVQ